MDWWISEWQFSVHIHDRISGKKRTSGGARWNYLAAWAYAAKKFDGDEEKIKDFIKKLYANVLVLDSVAIVDSVVDKKGTREVATEYLNYLYSDEAQRIAGDNYYRPSNEDILKEYADVFDLNVNLVTIDDFGGWEKAQETHFADGGVFDQIYEE